MTKKFPWIASLVCLCAVILLCCLGFWQLERLTWKTNLQAELDAAFSVKTPPSLTDHDIQDIEKGQILRGLVKGNIDFSKPAYFHGRIQDGRSVAAVVVPLTVPPSNRVISVEIGCGEKISPDIFLSSKQMTIPVVGVIRQLPNPSFVTPPNIIEKNEWWRFDTKNLSDYWGTQNLLPVLMTVENTAEISKLLRPCSIEKNLRNEHFSYAVFWFSMAFVVTIIWVIRFLRPYLQSA